MTARPSTATAAAYRYRLERQWCGGHGRCAFIMLNPSTADELGDDPTIRRCIAFARCWGYAGLIVANLFALRATDPLALFTAHDPVGDPANRDAILGAIDEAALVLCAWGHFPAARARGQEVVALVRERGGTPYCLGLTKRGAPRHPLYVPATTRPMILSASGVNEHVKFRRQQETSSASL